MGSIGFGFRFGLSSGSGWLSRIDMFCMPNRVDAIAWAFGEAMCLQKIDLVFPFTLSSISLVIVHATDQVDENIRKRDRSEQRRKQERGECISGAT